MATGSRRDVVRGAADDGEDRASWALALSTHVEAAGCLSVPADAVLAVVGCCHDTCALGRLQGTLALSMWDGSQRCSRPLHPHASDAWLQDGCRPMKCDATPN
jgi:hypothetical protein